MAFERQFGVIFTNPKLPVLDYSTLDDNIGIGSLVEVPLGSKVVVGIVWSEGDTKFCLLYTSPSPRDAESSRMPSSA